MATYKKKLKTLVVHLMLDSQTVTIADTADDDKATRALNEFKSYETMHYEADGVTNGIPYHAVQYIEVTETEADIEKSDPYGCDEGGSDTVTVTYGACGDGGVQFSRTEGGEMETLRQGESVTLDKGSTLWFGNNTTVNTEGGEALVECQQGDGSYTFTESVTICSNSCE